MGRTLAVVGAGAAGASAAYALRSEPVDVTVFEKSGSVCGRAATRRKDDCVYEYGANYLKADDERVNRLVTEKLPADGLVDVEKPVWVFDDEGTIREGQNPAETKWSYESGITQLAKRLLDATEATTQLDTRVEALDKTSDGWEIEDGEGTSRGTFDGVLLTPPAPQTADLLGQSGWQHADRRRLREAIASVPYRTLIAGVLHYDFELSAPYYALVNDDKKHDIGWIGREECKPGHVPDGESLLLVQMAPDWSVDHYRDPPEAILDGIAEATATLLDDDRLASPDWTDHQHWRYALPDDGVDDDLIVSAADHDLYFAGDWVAGEARLHSAIRSGLEAGERVAQHL